jgi:uncharacterized peroxidase-related enzyme
MPYIPILEESSAPDEVRAVYEDFYRRMSFPAAPNFIKTQGHSRTSVRGTWDLVRNVLVVGLIPRYVKEMLFVAISKDRECRYCEAAHIACCRMLGVSPGLLESLTRDINAIGEPRLRDMILFGLKCSRDPQGLTTADFDRLHGHGLREPEIVELIAMAGLAVYANIMADATGMEADGMFAAVAAGGGEGAGSAGGAVDAKAAGPAAP